MPWPVMLSEQTSRGQPLKSRALQAAEFDGNLPRHYRDAMSSRRIVQLFSLSDAEYAEFSVLQVSEYANQLVHAGEVTSENGLVSARERLEDLLADRLRAKGHEFHRAASSSTSVTVGWLWTSPAPEFVGARHAAARWLSQITVNQAFRGLGWGRAILLEAERSLALLGVEQVWLRVFNWNTIARRLYESLAYELVTQFPTDAHFRKRLTHEGTFHGTRE